MSYKYVSNMNYSNIDIIKQITGLDEIWYQQIP